MAYFYGSSGNDTLNGQGTADWFYGGQGHDFFVGDAGNDRAYGGAGNDGFLGGAGDDFFDGGLGFNTIRFGGTSGVSVNLSIGTASDGQGGTDSFVNVGGVGGTAHADTLIGGSSRYFHNGEWLDYELFIGFAGNDLINGGAGFDEVSYANDINGVSVDLNAGTATDGWGGSDTLLNIERVRGSSYNDTLTGSSRDEQFEGGGGADGINGGGGFDWVIYQNEVAPVTVNLGTGTAVVAGAADTLSNIEAVRGSSFNDRLTGNAAANSFRGMEGNDTINGGGGVDSVDYFGDNSRDGTMGVTVNLATGRAIDGYGCTDVLSYIENVGGTRYEDTLTGNNGANAMRAGAGDDTLDGGAGNDSLAGETGADRLIGGAGRDSLSGGAGADVFYWAAKTHGRDSIADFSRVDTLEFSRTGFGAGLKAGELAANQFRAVAGGLANTTAQRFLYDSSTRKLYFDADGSGAGARVEIATFAANSVVRASSIVIA